MNEIEISVLRSFRELDSIRTFWEQTQHHPNSDFAFFKLIVEARGEKVAPCVFVFRIDGEVVALLVGRIESLVRKLQIGYFKLGGLKVRQLVLIDGGFMGTSSESVWTALYRYLDGFLVAQGIDCAQFSQIPVPSLQYSLGMRLFGDGRFSLLHEPTDHWSLKLPQTFEEFLQSRSRKHRYWIKRLSNVLDKEFPNEWSIRCYQSPDDVAAFEDGAESVARVTYHRAMGVGFRSSEETRRRLTLEAAHGGLRGYLLFIKGSPQAFWHCNEYRGRLHLCSTGYAESFRKYELGTVLLMRVFEDQCGPNSPIVDFGLGDAGYKQRFGSDRYQEASVMLYSRSAKGIMLRATFFLVRASNSVAQNMVRRLGATQKLKTFIRRQLTGAGKTIVPAKKDTPESNEPD